MRTYRRLWGVLLTVVTTAAVAAMVSRSEPSQVVALMVALGSLGAVLGLAWGSELPAPRYPVLVGAAVAALASVALPGLVVLVGWAAGPVCLLLAVSSPPVVGNGRVRRLAGLVEVPLGDPDGGRLRADWEITTNAMAADLGPEDRLVLVRARARILADIEAHHGGLPAYVWGPLVPRGAGPNGHERSGPGPRDLGP